MASRTLPTAPSFTDAGNRKWDQFYERANAVLNQIIISNSSTNNDATVKKSAPHGKKNRGKRRKQKIALPIQQQDSPQVVLSHLESILSSLHSLLTQLSIPQREYATQKGAFSVIVRSCQVYLSLPPENINCTSKIVILACKSFRLCVFQNPTGRALCRASGVFGVLHKLMITLSGDGKCLEDIYTALAAICLGDDLNTLVANLQFGDIIIVQQNIEKEPVDAKTDETASNSTLSYLQKLFEVIRHEQAPLLEQWETREELLLERIINAEQDLLAASQRLQNQQWTQAETAFTRALVTLEEIPGIAQHTLLMNECLLQLLEGRVRVRLHMEDWEGVLQDVKQQTNILGPLLLESKQKSHIAKLLKECRVIAWTRQSDALKELRRFDEAQEVLESAITFMEGSSLAPVFSVQSFSFLPSDPAITLNSLHKKWNQLQLAKAKSKAKSNAKSIQQEEKGEIGSPTVDHMGATGTAATTSRSQHSSPNGQGQDEFVRGQERRQQSIRGERQGQPQDQDEYMDTTSCASSSSSSSINGQIAGAQPGTYVQCLYGTGTVQEVRQCGTTKIQLLSWSPGRQAPTAYLMPGCYTVLGGDGVDVASE